MSASRGEKIFVTAVFVVFALPPGLCSMFVGFPGTMLSLFNPTPGSGETALLFAMPSLIGFAIFGGLLWLLIRTWGHTSP